MMIIGSYNCYTGEGADGRSIWNRVTAHLDWIHSVMAKEYRTSRCAPESAGEILLVSDLLESLIETIVTG